MTDPSTPSELIHDVAAPRIPPAPPARQRSEGDGRWIIWFAMLVLGAVVGVAFHAWLPAVNVAFDAWVTLALR